MTWCEVHDCVLCRASYSNSVFRLAVNSLAHDNIRLKHVWTATDRIPPRAPELFYCHCNRNHSEYLCVQRLQAFHLRFTSPSYTTTCSSSKLSIFTTKCYGRLPRKPGQETTKW